MKQTEPPQLSVLVTGASRGIGAATVRHFAERGHQVAALARSVQDLQALQDALASASGEVFTEACDVSDAEAVRAAFEAAYARFGCLDLVLNNAGLIDPISTMLEADADAWGHTIDVNLKGAFHVLQTALRLMQPQGKGMVINLSSGAANRPMEGWSAYCASKAALQMLTRCADLENRAHGLKVLGLSPGTVATPMQTRIRESGVNPVSQLPASAHIPPEWVAQAIDYLQQHALESDLGTDFSLKTAEGRQRVGLPPP